MNTSLESTKIVPHLWFDKEAKEAAQFYTALFENSKVTNTSVIKNTPSGDCDIVSFELGGQPFMAISAGPYFKPTPAISFMVNFDPSKDKEAAQHLDNAWTKLSDGGKILMDIGEYPFSKRYGWIQDRYGFSWQLILTNPEGEERPFIIPTLLFVSDAGKIAEEATDYYLTIFKHARRGALSLYQKGMGPNTEGAIMFTDFTLEGQWFAAMDGISRIHAFTFNEAVSFMVNCEEQAEIDYYWKALSAVPESEQCGWLKDKYGVSWQIVPRAMNEMMTSDDRDATDRVTRAFLAMKKFDIATLQAAYEGK